MIIIVIEIEISKEGDLGISSQAGCKGVPHPEEVRVAKIFRDAINAEEDKFIANAKFGAVEASGPNAKEICDNVAKQYHRENPS